MIKLLLKSNANNERTQPLHKNKDNLHNTPKSKQKHYKKYNLITNSQITKQSQAQDAFIELVS